MTDPVNSPEMHDQILMLEQTMRETEQAAHRLVLLTNMLRSQVQAIKNGEAETEDVTDWSFVKDW